MFAPTPGGGERSERPAFQGHVGYGRGTPEGAGEAQVGLSGHYGWIREAGPSHSRVGGRRSTSTSGAAASGWPVRRIMADELDAYGSGVGQPGRSEGGWIEGRPAGRLRACRSTVAPRSTAGPMATAAAGRLRNTSAFGNADREALTPEVSASVEYKWLETRYGSPAATARITT